MAACGIAHARHQGRQEEAEEAAAGGDDGIVNLMQNRYLYAATGKRIGHLAKKGVP